MTSANWYVAETLPRAEKYAEANLGRQGFASFCPRFSKQRRHARRIDRVLVPVFPGYVFVRFDRQRDQWTSINGTLGIRRLVGASSSRPQAMPESAMQALFERCTDDIMSCILPELEPGQQVRVVSGPFMGQLATIERLDDHGRVRVLLDILGGQAPVRMLAGSLAPA